MNASRDIRGFLDELLDRAARIRMPELFVEQHRDALYFLRDRHGVSVTALRTPCLTEHQLRNVLTYRLVQYLLADQLDPDLIYSQRLAHEPASNVSRDDIHILAGDAKSGELLCYYVIESLAGVGETSCFGDPGRPSFPVEEVFGSGVYKRLKLLSDLPATRVREIGRFAKNHQRDPFDELVIRAPVENSVALLGLLKGRLQQEIDACIGDIELGVVKKNLDYFHVPTVVVRGVVPYADDGSFAFYNYQRRTRYPFAFFAADISRDRLDVIEHALELPGKEGVMALLALKGDRSTARSSLEPIEGLSPLANADVPQQGVPMTARKQALDLGHWLRGTSFFETLSTAESAVLGTFLERVTADAGEVILRQGDVGDDLYLIEAGNADVVVSDRSGGRMLVKTLGPGQSFGEIALVTGGERTADVVAATRMRLLRLSHDAYARYLAHLVDVEGAVTRTALSRVRETLGKVRSGDE